MCRRIRSGPLCERSVVPGYHLSACGMASFSLEGILLLTLIALYPFWTSPSPICSHEIPLWIVLHKGSFDVNSHFRGDLKHCCKKQKIYGGTSVHTEAIR